MQRRAKYEDIPWAESIDRPHTIEGFRNNSYKNLAGLVLNDKYDIKYSAAAGTPSTAAAFAKKKRLKAKLDQDINNDGVDDIILYDANGDPVYINGYHFRPSEFQLRKEYDNRFPSKEDRARIGGYSGFKKGFYTDFDQGMRQEYLDRVNDARYLDDNHNSKYFIPSERQPRANISLYQKFASQVVPPLTNIIRDYVYSVNYNKSHATSCIPIMELTSVLYIKEILAGLWGLMDGDAGLSQVKARIMSESTDPDARYKSFKSYLSNKRNKDNVDRLIGTNWDAIFRNVTDVGKLRQLFEMMGFTQAYIASPQCPDNVQVKLEPNAKIEKMRVKDSYSQWMKSYKNAAIAQIFAPDPAE